MGLSDILRKIRRLVPFPIRVEYFRLKRSLLNRINIDEYTTTKAEGTKNFIYTVFEHKGRFENLKIVYGKKEDLSGGKKCNKSGFKAHICFTYFDINCMDFCFQSSKPLQQALWQGARGDINTFLDGNLASQPL